MFDEGVARLTAGERRRRAEALVGEGRTIAALALVLPDFAAVRDGEKRREGRAAGLREPSAENAARYRELLAGHPVGAELLEATQDGSLNHMTSSDSAFVPELVEAPCRLAQVARLTAHVRPVAAEGWRARHPHLQRTVLANLGVGEAPSPVQRNPEVAAMYGPARPPEQVLADVGSMLARLDDLLDALSPRLDLRLGCDAIATLGRAGDGSWIAVAPLTDSGDEGRPRGRDAQASPAGAALVAELMRVTERLVLWPVARWKRPRPPHWAITAGEDLDGALEALMRRGGFAREGRFTPFYESEDDARSAARMRRLNQLLGSLADPTAFALGKGVCDLVVLGGRGADLACGVWSQPVNR